MTSDSSTPEGRLTDRDHHWLAEPSAAINQLADDLDLGDVRERPHVVGEEIQALSDRLEELLAIRRQTDALNRQHFATLLPLPMLDTDASGRISVANAAATVRLDMPLARLIGLPLADFVREEDRPALRSALDDAAPEPSVIRVVLTPRRSPPVAADLIVSAGDEPGRDGSAQWTVLVGRGNPDVRTAPGPLVLAAAVAAISHLPANETDVGSLLTRFARAAAAALDRETSISVNVGRPSEPTHVAATSQEATALDGLQILAGEGPCVLAYDVRDSVVADDVRTDGRWPRLQTHVLASPIRSVLAVPILAGGTRVGVLNSYSTAPHAFSDDHMQVADVLAVAAGAALDAVRETTELRRHADQLHAALDSRSVIDQAKGILMARRGCTADEAFAHLAALSQRRNVRVRELARLLVEQTVGTAPEAGVPRS